MENIIEADPDYIFVIPMGNDDAAAEKNLKENVESNPAWSSLTAVQNNHYILQMCIRDRSRLPSRSQLASTSHKAT